MGSQINLSLTLKEIWMHNTTNFTHIFSLWLFLVLLMIHSWFISLWWERIFTAKDENEFSLVLRGPNHFVAPSLLLSRWNYYVAYLFDMNMLPIWEVHMTEELVEGLFFCNNLVNYKYITCSLLCFLYTCWMCLIQIWQKYIRSSTVGKHNFGYILCFVYQLSNCFCFFGGEGVC